MNKFLKTVICILSLLVTASSALSQKRAKTSTNASVRQDVVTMEENGYDKRIAYGFWLDGENHPKMIGNNTILSLDSTYTFDLKSDHSSYQNYYKNLISAKQISPNTILLKYNSNKENHLLTCENCTFCDAPKIHKNKSDSYFRLDTFKIKFSAPDCHVKLSSVNGTVIYDNSYHVEEDYKFYLEYSDNKGVAHTFCLNPTDSSLFNTTIGNESKLLLKAYQNKRPVNVTSFIEYNVEFFDYNPNYIYASIGSNNSVDFTCEKQKFSAALQSKKSIFFVIKLSEHVYRSVLIKP